MVAEGLVAQADREERLLAGHQAVDDRAQDGHLRVARVARVAGAGTDDHQVGGVEDRIVGRGVVLVVPDDAARHAEHPEHVAQHLDEVVLAVEDDHVLAAQPRVGGGAGLVGEPEACSAVGCGR